MELDDVELKWAVPRTGAKNHLIPTDGSTSILILGSQEYDTDVHDRALCGTISDFTDADEPADKEVACFPCARKAVDRGLVDDPTPFDAGDLQGTKRDYD